MRLAYLAVPSDGLESRVPCQAEHYDGPADEKVSVCICCPGQSASVAVWHGIHSLGCPEPKRFVLCTICTLHSTRRRFQPNQSSASSTDNPQRSRICLLSLAIVHLGLEALIACDYPFLWRFLSCLRKCRSVVRLSTWRCYLSIFILRNAQRFNETGEEYLKAGSVHCCGRLAVCLSAVPHSVDFLTSCKTPVHYR